MTRINVVHPSQLSDKHLLAEYKEITRPFNKVIKRIENGTMQDIVIPDNYCLGKGHETFFFNKLGYLILRYQDLFEELQARGVSVNKQSFFEIYNTFCDKLANGLYWNDWQPSTQDIYLNMARLVKRCKFDNVLAELEV